MLTQRMPIIYKPRTRYNATSGIQSAITMAFQHYRSHSCVPVVCTGFAQSGNY